MRANVETLISSHLIEPIKEQLQWLKILICTEGGQKLLVLHVVGGPGGSGKAVGLRAESMQRSVVLGVIQNGRSSSKVIL